MYTDIYIVHCSFQDTYALKKKTIDVFLSNSKKPMAYDMPIGTDGYDLCITQ